MRLTQKQCDAFIEVLSTYICQSAELRLFGSRTNNLAKGGDIDLLLLIHNDNLKEKLLSNKPEILGQIKNLIGDQKIDLIIESNQHASNNAFLCSILPHSVLLHTWPI